MKTRAIIFALFILAAIQTMAQTHEKNEAESGLKQYIFVMYTKGPNRTHDSATVQKIQQGHLNHLDSLYNIGLLNVAGPFMEEGDWRGILVFDVATKEEAEAHVKKDPAVVAGRLSYVIIPWMTQKGNCFK